MENACDRTEGIEFRKKFEYEGVFVDRHDQDAAVEGDDNLENCSR